MTDGGFSISGVGWRVKRPDDAGSGFACSKPYFEEHFRITSTSEQQELMGQPYVFVWNGRIVGYLVLAMEHLNEKKSNLDIDEFRDIPALLISHLATDSRYVRRGVGSLMVRWAIKVAVFLSGIVGCRAVLVKSEPDVVGFYEKLGFRKTSETKSDLADMYLDIKPMAGTAARDGPDLPGRAPE